MKTSPRAQVVERFGSKQDLVQAIEDLGDDLFLDRTNQDKGLERVSNAKLLRLHSVLTEVKESFGSREKLIDAICDLEKRKDSGYRERLEDWGTPRLLDWYRASKRRDGRPPKRRAKR